MTTTVPVCTLQHLVEMGLSPQEAIRVAILDGARLLKLEDRIGSRWMKAETTSRRFAAAVIIGGMEGVFEELNLFTHHHPDALVLPLASTGAAAGIIYRDGNYDPELGRALTFPSLFRRRLL